VSRLPENERLFNTLTECSEKIKKELKLIDEENNNLPIDGFKWLAFINADIQDLMSHIEKFDSYDLG